MTVTKVTPGLDEEPYTQRLNLESPSGITAFVKMLKDLWGAEVNWTETVARAKSRLVTMYRNTPRHSRLSHEPDRVPRRFFIDEIVPEGHHSILYAPPASGKSYTVGDMALSVALGIPFCGRPTIPVPVLVLDYEMNDKVEWERRLERLILGHGMDPWIMEDMPFVHMCGNGIPLAEQWQAVRKVARDNGIQQMFVDSIGPAVGGELFDPRAAMAYFAALDRIGVTSLSIGQSPAGDSEKLYGNVFWEYAPHGRVWALSRGETEGKDRIDIAWRCAKTSNGRWPLPWGMELLFADDEAGPVMVREQAIPDLEEAKRLLGGTIWQMLGDRRMTIAEIAKELGARVDAVKDALFMGRGESFRSAQRFDGAKQWEWYRA
jgi:hypothetical protein